jgi:hypothetical protein
VLALLFDTTTRHARALTRASIFLEKRDGLPGHRQAEAPPFFERLCPAMTKVP